jgi:hypothetical protein
MRIDQQVRLSTNVIAAISRNFLEHFLPNDKLWLFGSRVDSSKKGGDIDLYIETNIDIYDIAFDKKIAFLLNLKKEVGDQKIDVVLRIMSSDHHLPIYEVAKSQGVRLV